MGLYRFHVCKVLFQVVRDAYGVEPLVKPLWCSAVIVHRNEVQLQTVFLHVVKEAAEKLVAEGKSRPAYGNSVGHAANTALERRV